MDEVRRHMESNPVRTRRVLVGADGYLRWCGNDIILRAFPERRAALRRADDSRWRRCLDGVGGNIFLQRASECFAVNRNCARIDRLVPFASLILGRAPHSKK